MKPTLLAGEWVTAGELLPVANKYTGAHIDDVPLSDARAVDRAFAAAVTAFERTRRTPAVERAALLERIAAGIAARHRAFTDLIVAEGGKPRMFAAAEVDRAIVTMKTSAEEAKRSTDSIIKLDGEQTGVGRIGIMRRFPLGPVLAISPFNFPLNLVCHKIGPALAAGNSVVLKPAPATPLTALLLGEVLVDAGAGDAVSIVVTTNDIAAAMVKDPRVAMISFTGSTSVGWAVHAANPRARVTLELGGNAAAIVAADADLEHAAARIRFGGFYQAGQSCVAVQRVLVHRSVYDTVADLLVRGVGTLVTGDPDDERTQVGPLISAASVDRVHAWVSEAIASGARALIGADRADPCYLPTVLVDVEPSMKVSCEEIFGPVVTLSPFDDIGDAFATANDSPFGLQAGLFTRDLETVFRAHREIRVGGLIHNDVSAWRADLMPYGGVKASGIGREGPRSAIEDMSEARLLVVDEGTS